MNSAQTILSEIQAISPVVANLPKTTPFDVPTNYFQENINRIIRLIQKQESGNEIFDATSQNDLKSEDKGFILPTGYFESFSQTLLEKIRAEQSVDDELNEMAPGLARLRGINPFFVPKSYFDSAIVKSPLKKPGSAPVVEMKKIIRYAAAACIVGFCLMTFLKNDETNDPVSFARKTNNEKVEILSTDDMMVYLNQMEGIGQDGDEDLSDGDGTNLLVDLNQQTIKDVLNGIPDKVIMDYIEEAGLYQEKTIN